MPQVFFRSIATATPDGTIDRDHYARFASRISARIPREEALIHAVARHSGIEQRHSVIVDEGENGGRYSLYEPGQPDGAWPATGERMRAYARFAPELAAKAAGEALIGAGIPAPRVTHLITASCTGFFAPGIDAELIQRLGLSPGISRTHIGFMGCHAAINVLSAARAHVRAEPGAVVLCVCVELCTLHFQQGIGRNTIVPNSLFADGAAAFVLAGERGEECSIELVATEGRLFPGSREAMTWLITDTGFRMTLDSSVPDLIQREVRPFAEGVLSRHGLELREISGWAIHPGGPRVVDSVLRAFCLAPDYGDASRKILTEFGNMSSPTVLFILKELLARGTRGPMALIAFGPGLVAEMALLKVQ